MKLSNYISTAALVVFPGAASARRLRDLPSKEEPIHKKADHEDGFRAIKKSYVQDGKGGPGAGEGFGAADDSADVGLLGVPPNHQGIKASRLLSSDSSDSSSSEDSSSNEDSSSSSGDYVPPTCDIVPAAEGSGRPRRTKNGGGRGGRRGLGGRRPNGTGVVNPFASPAATCEGPGPVPQATCVSGDDCAGSTCYCFQGSCCRSTGPGYDNYDGCCTTDTDCCYNSSYGDYCGNYGYCTYPGYYPYPYFYGYSYGYYCAAYTEGDKVRPGAGGARRGGKRPAGAGPVGGKRPLGAGSVGDKRPAGARPAGGKRPMGARPVGGKRPTGTDPVNTLASSTATCEAGPIPQPSCTSNYDCYDTTCYCYNNSCCRSIGGGDNYGGCCNSAADCCSGDVCGYDGYCALF